MIASKWTKSLRQETLYILQYLYKNNIFTILVKKLSLLKLLLIKFSSFTQT